MLKRSDTTEQDSAPVHAALEFAIVKRELDGHTSVVSVEGDLDLSTAPRLKWMLVDLLEEGTTQVVVDLAGVGFMDSTALGVLVAVNRSLDPGVRMAIACAQDKVMQIFEFSGTEKAFAIYRTLDEALDHVRGHPAAAG